MQSNLATKVLTTVISWVGAIAMIALVIFLIKDVIAIIKGEGSIGKTLGKVVCVFLVLGIMFSAGSFQTFGNMFSTYFNGVVTSGNLPSIGTK